MSAKKPKAYSYLRFSTPEQSKGDSSRRQTELAVKYAAANGLELDQSSYQDLGVSAYRSANAETGMLGEFLEAVKVGTIPRGSYLLIESLDRLSRAKPRKAVRLLESICEEGITLVTLSDAKAYTEESLDEDPMAFMWAFMVAIRANEESATKGRRLKAAWVNKRAQAEKTGKPLTSRSPAWMKLDKDAGKYVLIEDRLRIVQRIFKLYLTGTGENKIAQILNQDQVPSFGDAGRASKMWHRSYVHKILTNPATIGTGRPHKLEYIEGKKTRVATAEIPGLFPAAIDPEVFAKVQAMKAAGMSRDRSADGISNILATLSKCPLCGGAMYRVNKGVRGGKPYLVCGKAKSAAGCTYHIVPLDRVERTVMDRIDEILDSAPSGDSSLDDEHERLTELVGTCKHLGEMAGEAVLANPSSRILGERLTEIEAERDRLEAELASLEEKMEAMASGPILAARMATVKEAMRAKPQDKARINATLKIVLAGVVVDYERRTLVLAWKHGGTSEVIYDHGWAPDKTA